MLSYFPSLYPDELMYSWFARYHQHSSNPSPKQTMKELFGSPCIVAVADLPANISSFYENIKQFNPLSLSILIGKHTFYKYYTFFQSDEIKQKAKNYLKYGGKPGAIHMFLGIASSAIKDWQYIRFCPSCLKADRAKYGEAYWHLSHQLPKVYYCHQHQEPLQDSTVELRNPQKHEFISAEKAELVPQHIKSLYSSKTQHHLEQLSEESIRLINEDTFFNFNEIQKIYRYLMQVRGFANHLGKVHQQYFSKQFKQYYSEEFLSLMDCNFDEYADTSWLRSIVRKHRKAFHPVQHLLLLNFLEVSLKELNHFKGKVYHPFGTAPFYCLNPAADHYRVRVVNELTITTCTDTRKPVGTFTCQCGFIYSRRGPDIDETDILKVGRIKEFGDVWREKLKKLVSSGLSYYAIAQILECDYATVKKYVENQPADKQLADVPPSLAIAEKECEWIKLIKEYPNLTVTQLRKLSPALYAWHYRNNQQWLKENTPRVHTKGYVNNRVDWQKRDLGILAQVKRAIKELYTIEKPIYVNKSRVGKLIGQLSLLEKLLNKLPNTKAYLEKHLETREQYQIRRIKWACQSLYENNDEQVAEWKVRRLAGLRKELSPFVENALHHEIRKYQQGGISIETKTVDI